MKVICYLFSYVIAVLTGSTLNYFGIEILKQFPVDTSGTFLNDSWQKLTMLFAMIIAISGFITLSIVETAGRKWSLHTRCFTSAIIVFLLFLLLCYSTFGIPWHILFVWNNLMSMMIANVMFSFTTEISFQILKRLNGE